MVFDIKPEPGNPRNSEGDTILLGDGRLLLAWSHFKGREDHATADVCDIISDDGGVTWGPERVLVSAEEAELNVMSVSLLREALTGDLLLFYLRKNSLADCQLFLRRSVDEGETWGAPRRISSRDGYHVMNNARVVQLASGRLLAPVALTPDYGETRHQNAFCYISDDGGVTWREGRGSTDIAESAVGCQEPGLVDLGQRTLMYIRSDQGYIYGAISTDGGETWGLPAPFRDLPAPAAPATIARLPGGRLVALYNHRPDGAQAGWADRTPLAAAASDDGGDSWQRLEDIEPSTDYCYGYTSFRVYGENIALTYYVWPRGARAGFEQTTLRFRMLPLDRLR